MRITTTNIGIANSGTLHWSNEQRPCLDDYQFPTCINPRLLGVSLKGIF